MKITRQKLSRCAFAVTGALWGLGVGYAIDALLIIRAASGVGPNVPITAVFVIVGFWFVFGVFAALHALSCVTKRPYKRGAFWRGGALSQTILRSLDTLTHERRTYDTKVAYRHIRGHWYLFYDYNTLP